MNSSTRIRSLMLKVSAFTVLAAPQLLQSEVAHAEGNPIGGAICRADFGGIVEYNNYAAIVNAGSTTMHVVCPIDRESFGPVGRSYASLVVTDNNTTSDVVCAINSANPGSSPPFVASPQVSSSGTGVNLQLFMSTAHLTDNDYTWVSCFLPPFQPGVGKSSLQTFWTYEF